MKRLLFYAIIAVALSSCNKDDDNKPVVQAKYSVYITVHCPESGSGTPYCISKDTYDTLHARIMEVGEVCKHVTFDDTDGAHHSGYLVSVGTGCSQ